MTCWNKTRRIKNSVVLLSKNKRDAVAQYVILVLLIPLAALSWVAIAEGAMIIISPPPLDAKGEPVCEATEEFEQVANALQPGDELVLTGGVYCQTGQRKIVLSGEESNLITIRAADGEVPIFTRPDDPKKRQKHNGIEIQATYAEIRGLHFERGDTGVRILGGTHHLTFEDCEISSTSNNGLTLNSGDTDSLIIRRNHIHHTGLSGKATEGEGIYVGCHDGSCTASNHLVENNYIHHLRGTSSGGNDGIEVKYGSFGNVIRDNVIHDTTIGTSFPCIFVYGVRDSEIEPPNIVEGNVMWNCGEAIQLVSDVVIRNNIILDSITGIMAAGHVVVPTKRNVSIVNNTIAGHESESLLIRWSDAANMVLANNAVYSSTGNAVDATGLTNPTVTVRDNYVEGALVVDSTEGFLDGGTATDAFGEPSARDYWPTVISVLQLNANPSFVTIDDFNGTPRTAPYDVGAYETEGLAENPGWRIVAGFKNITVDETPPNPVTDLEARIKKKTQVKLTWSPVSDPEGGAVSYVVFRDDSELASTSSTNYLDQTTESGNTYIYYIAAVDDSRNASAPSNMVSVTLSAK
jgi:hypothetical protein